jgi:hypothetical protein
MQWVVVRFNEVPVGPPSHLLVTSHLTGRPCVTLSAIGGFQPKHPIFGLFRRPDAMRTILESMCGCAECFRPHTGFMVGHALQLSQMKKIALFGRPSAANTGPNRA